MRRPFHVFGASAAALLAIAALVAWPVPSKAAEVCGPAPGHTADRKVILKDNAYSPPTVALTAAGQSVCWEHQDGQIGHSITSDAAPGSPDYFDFPGPECTSVDDPDCFQQGDQPWKLILNSSGTFNYHCKIHSTTMKGVITVQGGGGGVPAVTTTRPPAPAPSTTRPPTTGTTVGTLTPETTTPVVETTTSVAETTTSSTASTTSTTSSAIGIEEDDDDDEPSGVLKAVGVVLLAAAIAGLIPAWRRLT